MLWYPRLTTYVHIQQVLVESVELEVELEVEVEVPVLPPLLLVVVVPAVLDVLVLVDVDDAETHSATASGSIQR